MTKRDARVTLAQMLAHAEEACAMLEGRTRRDLDAHRMLVLAATRLLEIVGEAATRVPDADRLQLPAVPWREIIGLRNRLIHGYDSVDLDILWATLTIDVPALVEVLRRDARRAGES